MNITEFCETHGVKATDHGNGMTVPRVDEDTGELLQESFLARRIQLQLEVDGVETVESWVEIDVSLIRSFSALNRDFSEDEFICDELRCYIEGMKQGST